MNLRVESTDIGGRQYMIKPVGEVDLYTAPQLREELLSAIATGPRRVVVDLSDTTFIDSTTLGVLLSGVKRLRPSGGELVVVCADPNIRKIFEITLLDRVFTIYETRAEALAQATAAH